MPVLRLAAASALAFHVCLLAGCSAMLVGAHPDPAPVSAIMTTIRNEREPVVLVAAHRGAHGNAPENSLKSIEDAVRLGVDIVELDIRVTRDGVPVLMHDATVDATTNGTGAVGEMTFEDLRSLRLKMRRGPTGDVPLSDERVPSLQEAMGVARGRIAVDLDLKTADVAAIADIINATETGDQVLWFDTPSPGLDLAIRLVQGTILMPRAYSQADVEAICRRYPAAEVIHIDGSFLTPETIETAASCGARTWMNALGDVDRAIRSGADPAEVLSPMIDGGVTVIQTDEPEALLRYLRKAGRRATR